MSDIVERLREALPALKGWMLNRAEPGEDEGTAIVGGSHDDGDFAPVATVDTGLYYQDAHALPLAEAIAAAVTAAPELLAELDRLRAQVAALSAPAPAQDGDALAARVNAMKPGETLDLRGAAPAPAEPVAWECKAGWLRPLTDAQYRKQPANIQRHYTRIAAPAAPAAIDVERLLAECLPGGSVCDPQQVADAIRTYFNAWDAAPAAPAGWQLVPVEPTPGLLMSMAIRYDHGFGVPGYYDQLRALLPGDSATHAQRLQATLATMRQLYEEVSGQGFYRPEREAEYAALAAAPGAPQGDKP